jgi:hypothetical protein
MPPIAGPPLCVSHGDDAQAMRIDSKDDLKGESFHGARSFTLSNNRESQRIARDFFKSSFHSNRETLRHARALFEIPIRRLAQFESGIGMKVNPHGPTRPS